MPAPPFAVTVVPDVEYAAPDGAPLRTDLYLPALGAPAPLILWIHGGGWRYGHRRLSPDLSRVFAERGFAMAAIDYRFSSRATFPAQIEDVRTAIRWCRRVAGTYGFDPGRIGLMGASAGGHLAALAGLAPEDLFQPDGAACSTRVQAVVVGYAPVDFLQLDAHRAPEGTPSADPENLPMPRGMRSADADSFESMLLGAPIGTRPDLVRVANPITYAGPGAPPFLILHGSSDTTVPLHQSEILFDALAAHGADVTLAIVGGLGHGFLSRRHLDDGPARPMAIRRAHGSERYGEERSQPVFPFVEAFFAAHLRERDRSTPQRAGGPS